MADEKPKKQSEQAEETAAEETPVVDETTPEAPAADAEAPETTTPAAEEPAETDSEEEQVADEPVAEAEAEPEADAEPEAEPEAAAPEAPAKRQRSQRHVPRSERRQRPKLTRERPKERKPIVRLPKPESELGRRQERRGIVVSEAMDKTIVVKVDVFKLHPRYKKVIRRSRKFHAHDERNEAHVGDTVRIVETRPISKTKSWRLAEVVEVAK